MKKFSDFSKEHGLEGSKLQISDVFGKEITVLGYRVMDSKIVKNKPCLQLQFSLDGEKHVLFSTSGVLLKQMEQYAEHVPFTATIKKIGNYHTFT